MGIGRDANLYSDVWEDGRHCACESISGRPGPIYGAVWEFDVHDDDFPCCSGLRG